MTTIIAQYHPAAALHQPQLWATMLDDWENLPKKVDANYTVVGDAASMPMTVALDTENAPDGTLGNWSVGWRGDDGRLYVFPSFGSQRFPFGNRRVIMHNAKWDLRVLDRAGMERPKDTVDTMVAAYSLGLGKQDVTADVRFADAGMIGGLGLKYLARRHLGMEMKTWAEVKDHPEEKEAYNVADTLATYLLWEMWKPTLPQFFWDIDMPLLEVLMAMEDRGILIDPKFLEPFAQAISTELAGITLPFNPNSPKQIIQYIYKDLGITPWAFTKKAKQPSTEASVLEAIDDPVVKALLRYRALSKEKETYIENYIERMDLEGRVHPEFKQCSTATGRLSCARPNLQNVKKENSEMRRLFIAPKGKKLIRLDFNQIELRVFAALTQDEAMLKAFAEGRIIHQETADSVGMSYDDAKRLNFGMLFGLSAWGLSKEFGVTIDEAKGILARYYGKYKAIEKYMGTTKEQAEATKRVSTWTGRTRRIDALYADDWRVKQEGGKQAVNMPIQGGASEIVKLAMIDLHYKHAAPMILQVHDELLFEIEENQAEDYARWLKEYVPTITELYGMRFPVDVSVGDNWKECIDGKKS